MAQFARPAKLGTPVASILTYSLVDLAPPARFFVGEVWTSSTCGIL